MCSLILILISKVFCVSFFSVSLCLFTLFLLFSFPTKNCLHAVYSRIFGGPLFCLYVSFHSFSSSFISHQELPAVLLHIWRLSGERLLLSKHYRLIRGDSLYSSCAFMINSSFWPGLYLVWAVWFLYCAPIWKVSHPCFGGSLLRLFCCECCAHLVQILVDLLVVLHTSSCKSLLLLRSQDVCLRCVDGCRK